MANPNPHSPQLPSIAETLFAIGTTDTVSASSKGGGMVGNPDGASGGMSMAFHGVIPAGEIDSVIPGLKTGGITLLTECGIDEDLLK